MRERSNEVVKLINKYISDFRKEKDPQQKKRIDDILGILLMPSLRNPEIGSAIITADELLKKQDDLPISLLSCLLDPECAKAFNTLYRNNLLSRANLGLIIFGNNSFINIINELSKREGCLTKKNIIDCWKLSLAISKKDIRDSAIVALYAEDVLSDEALCLLYSNNPEISEKFASCILEKEPEIAVETPVLNTPSKTDSVSLSSAPSSPATTASKTADSTVKKLTKKMDDFISEYKKNKTIITKKQYQTALGIYNKKRHWFQSPNTDVIIYNLNKHLSSYPLYSCEAHEKRHLYDSLNRNSITKAFLGDKRAFGQALEDATDQISVSFSHN